MKSLSILLIATTLATWHSFAKGETTVVRRWKGPEVEHVPADADLDLALTLNLIALREGSKSTVLSAAGRRAAEVAKTRAEAFVALHFPELANASDTGPGDEAAARLIGRAMVAGWRTVGFGGDGSPAKRRRELTSPDGKWSYAIWQDPTGRLSLTHIRMHVDAGIELEWEANRSPAEMTVHFSKQGADGRSTSTRTYNLTRGGMKKAIVRYHGGATVSYPLHAVSRPDGPLIPKLMKRPARTQAR